MLVFIHILCYGYRYSQYLGRLRWVKPVPGFSSTVLMQAEVLADYWVEQ